MKTIKKAARKIVLEEKFNFAEIKMCVYKCFHEPKKEHQKRSSHRKS